MLVVTKLDRLARSLPDAREILDDLTRRSVKLSLGGSLHDPTDPAGRLLFNVLAMVAEFEADLIRLRTREGMKVAAELGDLFGVARSTVYRAIQRGVRPQQGTGRRQTSSLDDRSACGTAGTHLSGLDLRLRGREKRQNCRPRAWESPAPRRVQCPQRPGLRHSPGSRDTRPTSRTWHGATSALPMLGARVGHRDRASSADDRHELVRSTYQVRAAASTTVGAVAGANAGHRVGGR